jgi:hypothetical protein
MRNAAYWGFASKKSFIIGTMTGMRSINVMCVVFRNMANLDAERATTPHTVWALRAPCKPLPPAHAVLQIQIADKTYAGNCVRFK